MIITIGKRLLMGVPTLIGVSIVIFLLLNVLPGDPLAGLLAPDSTQQDRDALAEAMGLNDPLPVRYVSWVSDLAHGDLGYSFSRRRDEVDILFTALKNTAILAAAAATIGITLGITLGTLAALVNGRWGDRAISMIAVVGLSIPQFWLAILLIIVFSANLRWLPASGMNEPNGTFFTSLKFLIMPATAAAMVSVGNITRMTRASLLQTYGEDFVMTLRAKGLHGRQIWLHAIKNAAPPIMTVAGLQVGFLLGGAVLVETIFSWPGMGQMIFQAIASRDLRLIQAAVLVLAVTFIVVNIVVDILQTIVNPRLRRVGA
jgi:peptide/nickel transport system permease protein